MATVPTAQIGFTDYARMPHVMGKSGNDPEALQKAAEHFESLFIDMWLKSARKANEAMGAGDFLGGNEMQMRQEMHDNEMAIHMSRNGGIGLASVIVRQLSGGVTAATGGAPPPVVNRPAVPDKIPPQLDESAAPVRPIAHRTSAFPDPESFVATLAPIVQRVAKAAGLPALAMLGQAALETGWGSAVMQSPEGELSHNLFGIKAKTSDVPQVSVPTREFELGRWVERLDAFRAYADWEGSVADYVQLVRESPRYQPVRDAGEDSGSYAKALQASGYATDPNYASKIMDVAERIARMLQ